VYSEPAGAGGQRRYNGNSQMSPREFGSSGQPHAAQQPPAGFKYDNYQGGLNPHQASPSATSPLASPHIRDGNGDVPMPDSHDSYMGQNPNSATYPLRPHHQHHLSSSRTASLQQEPSAAAQRYSPMEVMSPTSPYGPKSAGANHFSQQPAQRQSPTRPSEYAPQQIPYYSSRQGAAQLPPQNPYAPKQDSYSPSALSALDGSYVDPKSPKRAPPQSTVQPNDKGPVPEFKRIRAQTDLKPKVNDQPAFRRANPEGGFISVSRCVAD
jgi:dual specificity protein kinase YAK1